MKTYKILFFAIFLFALFLRLYRIETLTTYQGDQGRDLIHVYRITHEGKLTLLGHPATIGFYNGPLYYYILVPLLFVTRDDPVGGALTSVLFNSAGLIVLFFVVKDLISNRAALVASYLYAISPLMVEFGRTMLPPYFSSPFFFLWLYCLLRRKSKTHKLNFFVAGLSLGCLLQLHYLFGLLIFFTVVYALFAFNSYRRDFISIFLVGLVIPLMPFILFEFRHNFLNTHLMIGFIQQPHFQNFSLTATVSFIVKSIAYLLGLQSPTYLFFLLVPCLGISIWWQKKSYNSSIKIVFGLFLISILSLLILKVPAIYPAYHYLYIPLITLFIIIPYLLNFLPKALLGIFLMAVSGTSFYSFDFYRDHGFTMVSGWNLKKIKFIVSVIEKDEIKKPFAVASLVDGDTQAYHFRYLLQKDGFLPVDIDKYDTAHSLYLVTSDSPDNVLDYNLYEVNSLRPFKVTKSWNVGGTMKLVRINKELL